MHHMTRRKKQREYAKAKRNGFFKPAPPTAEEQAQIAEAFNIMLEKLKAMNHPITKNVQPMLV